MSLEEYSSSVVRFCICICIFRGEEERLATEDLEVTFHLYLVAEGEGRGWRWNRQQINSEKEIGRMQRRILIFFFGVRGNRCRYIGSICAFPFDWWTQKPENSGRGKPTDRGIVYVFTYCAVPVPVPR